MTKKQPYINISFLNFFMNYFEKCLKLVKKINIVIIKNIDIIK